MVRYLPYVEALQWLGTNVIEVRQFVRANSGVINNAVIRDSVLYLEPTGVPVTTIPGYAPIPVPVNNWIIRSGSTLLTMDPTTFTQNYVLSPV